MITFTHLLCSVALPKQLVATVLGDTNVSFIQVSIERSTINNQSWVTLLSVLYRWTINNILSHPKIDILIPSLFPPQLSLEGNCKPFELQSLVFHPPPAPSRSCRPGTPWYLVIIICRPGTTWYFLYSWLSSNADANLLSGALVEVEGHLPAPLPLLQVSTHLKNRN